MSTFDNSFDRTFRPILSDPGAPPTQEGCRRDGIYLTWLTLQGGWQYWLFEGPVQKGLSPSIVGKAVQGGLSRTTQKRTSSYLVLHTRNLTREEAEAVGTLLESISVFWLKHNDDNSVEQIPVTIPDSESQIWDSRYHTSNFTTTIMLPYRSSQRL